MLDWFGGDFDGRRRAADAGHARVPLGADDAVAAAWFVPNDPTVAMFTHLGLARFMTGDVAGAEQSLAHARAVAAELDFPHGPWSAAYAIWLELVAVDRDRRRRARRAGAGRGRRGRRRARVRGLGGDRDDAERRAGGAARPARGRRAGDAGRARRDAGAQPRGLGGARAADLPALLPDDHRRAARGRGRRRRRRASATSSRSRSPPRPACASTTPRRCAGSPRWSRRPAAGAGGGARARARARARGPFERIARSRALDGSRARARSAGDRRGGRVAILGGGMAGLATAWRLSEPGWREEIEAITVYQRGWRLGGKGASSRGAERPHRGARPAPVARLLRERLPAAARVLRRARPPGDRPGGADPDVARGAAAGRDRRASRTAARTAGTTGSAQFTANDQLPGEPEPPRVLAAPSCCGARSG